MPNAQPSVLDHEELSSPYTTIACSQFVNEQWSVTPYASCPHHFRPAWTQLLNTHWVTRTFFWPPQITIPELPWRPSIVSPEMRTGLPPDEVSNVSTNEYPSPDAF